MHASVIVLPYSASGWTLTTTPATSSVPAASAQPRTKSPTSAKPPRERYSGLGMIASSIGLSKGALVEQIDVLRVAGGGLLRQAADHPDLPHAEARIDPHVGVRGPGHVAQADVGDLRAALA